jgi:proteasome lid subunit RPN8/RPN11
MEVMGLMLGDFVDEYTVKVVDVFAMPQSGTGVSVEAVDPVFQTTMLDMLRQVRMPDSPAHLTSLVSLQWVSVVVSPASILFKEVCNLCFLKHTL